MPSTTYIRSLNASATLDQIVRLGGVAILVQLLLDQAHAQGDDLVRQVDGRCVFNMRAEDAMEFDESVQLLPSKSLLPMV